MLDVQAPPAPSCPPDEWKSGQILNYLGIDEPAPPSAAEHRHATALSEIAWTYFPADEPMSKQAVPSERPAAMCFSDAVDAMKAGKAVRRACGLRLYVFITEQGKRFSDALGCTVFINPDDVMATDWEIAGEAIGSR